VNVNLDPEKMNEEAAVEAVVAVHVAVDSDVYVDTVDDAVIVAEAPLRRHKYYYSYYYYYHYYRSFSYHHYHHHHRPQVWHRSYSSCFLKWSMSHPLQVAQSFQIPDPPFYLPCHFQNSKCPFRYTFQVKLQLQHKA
jgi:hypothetical protein